MGERVAVYRASHKEPGVAFGPLPGLRDANVVAYEFELPERFVPAAGRTSVERTFVLLDVGVSFANPVWLNGVEAETWYVELVSVETASAGSFTFRDLYVDVLVPRDGRQHRMLDFDEFADALEEGRLGVGEAADALRRWQAFLDRYLYSGRWPTMEWADFPPREVRQLAALPVPFAEPVRWSG